MPKMDSPELPQTEAAIANIYDQDELVMAEIGKVQQVRREFGFWTTLGLTASMMCTWEAVFFANLTAMINGGPSTLVWGFVYAWLGALATAASLAEMASIWPTSSGQYHWCAMLAPPRQKVVLSWFVGWLATIGWVANTAIGAFFAGTMIQGILVQNDASYGYERWHGTLLMWAVLLVVFVINSVGTRLLSLVEGSVMVIHLGAFLGILVPLVYYSEHGSAKDVFVTFNNLAGWKSEGLAWFVGLISANLPLIGYDGPAHMAEEVHNAASTVPWAMVSTVLVNGALGWAICIAFSFCLLPNFEEALSSPTGYNMITVFYKAVGSAGAAGMTAVLIILVWFATIGFLATSSRQTWAFARDRGLPFSRYFAHVNKTLALPLRAVVLCTIVPGLLALIVIGSLVAFNALVSISEVGIFTSYLIPIVLIMIKKIKGEEIRYGPWSMGKVGVAVNLFSAVFLVISILFSFFPPETPVSLETMNWSCVVSGGFVIIGAVWFAVYGRRSYDGPVVERTILATDDIKYP